MPAPRPNSPNSEFSGAFDGLASQGWSVLPHAGFTDGTHVDREAVRAIAGRFGALSRRDGGTDLWTVRPRSTEPDATFSLRAGHAGLHTDAAYRPDPEPVIALFCVNPAADGGDTVLLDGRAAFGSAAPADVAEYRRPHWRWTVPGTFRGSEPTIAGPYPVLSADGQVRWRADNLGVPAHLRGLAVRTAEHLASHPDLVRIRLTTDSVLICDNTRMLHGRTSFADAGRLLIRVRLVTR